jgi:hypothetical protein
MGERRCDEEEPGALSRRRLLLAGLATGGAFVAPQITSVASAASSTSCGTGNELLDFDDYTAGTTFNSRSFGSLTLTISTVAFAGTTLFASNRTVQNGPAGGVFQRYLRFEQVPNATGRGQTITIAFSSPVTNLSFSLFDIDTTNNGWRDEIFIDTTGFTFSIPAGSDVVQGGGGNSNRFRSSNNDNNVDADENDGNLNLGHPGPLTSFVIRYQNGNENGSSNQWIGMSDITFNC